jgi:hypothetical protein
LLIKQSGVDPLELEDEPNKDYQPGALVPSDTAVAIEDIQREISVDPEYQITSNVVNNMLDERSQDMLLDNPMFIKGIHEDIKSGAFQPVMAEAERLKLMDGAKRADFEYYLIAARQDDNAPMGQPNMQNLEQQSPSQKEKRTVSKSKRRSAGSSKTKVPPKTGPINWDELSDEELMSKREEILSRY